MLKVKYENRQVRFICLHIPINHIPVRSCDFLLVLFVKVGEYWRKFKLQSL